MLKQPTPNLSSVKNIVVEATGCSESQAAEALTQCNNHCKTAILMILLNINADLAAAKLIKHHGFIRHALLDQE